MRIFKKIKINTYRISGLTLVLILLVSTASSQEVEFRASTKGAVQVGEQFRVTYTVNNQANNFKGPSFSDFRVLSGPNQSTNQSYQIINGKVAQSFEITFTYYLQAVSEGSFDIEPATVVVDNKQYNSNPLKITVSKTQAPANQPGSSPGTTGQTGAISKEDVFIRAFISKNSPYQGEELILTYRIYTKIPISQLNISKMPSFQGFWYKNLSDDSGPLKQRSEVIDGEKYITADLRKIALYPQRSGEIRLDPLDLSCQAQLKVQSNRPRDPFFDSFFDDPFFNRNIRNVELDLSSNPVNINVKQLPSANRPVNFSGAVGQYSLKTEIDRTRLKANEPLVIKAIVSGKGNLELIDQFDIAFPPDFETYDPKVINNINTTTSGISGSRTFEYLAIPRNQGDFLVKPITFTYFDLNKNDYVTLSGPEYSIAVEKGNEEVSGISYSGVSQKDIQFIGSDIRHIHTHSIVLARIGKNFYGSLKFYLWLLIPLVLFIVIILLFNMNKRRMQDLDLVRKRKANKVAKRNLKQAAVFLDAGKTDSFYIEISRALWGYISNKFNVPLSELSIETVNHRLKAKSVSEENIGEFTEVLNNCEYARFAPGDKNRKMNEIYGSALNIISKIENELK
jgi:hypothetical protein